VDFGDFVCVRCYFGGKRNARSLLLFAPINRTIRVEKLSRMDTTNYKQIKRVQIYYFTWSLEKRLFSMPALKFRTP